MNRLALFLVGQGQGALRQGHIRSVAARGGQNDMIAVGALEALSALPAEFQPARRRLGSAHGRGVE